MPVTISEITVEGMWKYAQALTHLHSEELTRHRSVMTLDIDWDRYTSLERQGKFFGLGMWIDDVLIGYSLFFLDHHINYKDSLVASSNVFYLDPSHRGKNLGIQLIDESERCLKARGVIKVTWRIKYSNPSLSRLLEKKSYEEEEFVMSKLI